MAETFTIAFEQVQLLSGLDTGQGVWLFMEASLREAANPDVVLDIKRVGALPADANRPFGPNIPLGDEGLFATSLPQGQIVRNDWTSQSTSQSFPRFELPAMTVEPSQTVTVDVFMVPKIWFRTISVPRSEFDKWSETTFTALLGASGFGLAGAIAGGIIGFFLGEGDRDVEVPCSQTVVAARHVFTFDDLLALRSEGMRQFGPADNTGSPCGVIDSLYWLSADLHRPWTFNPGPKVEPTDCELRPSQHTPIAEWVDGIWLDRSTWERSRVGVAIGVTGASTANVRVFDDPDEPGAEGRFFANCAITADVPPSELTLNYYGNGDPPREISPTCPNCKRFTNVQTYKQLDLKFLSTLLLGPAHVGTAKWIDANVGTEQRMSASRLRQQRQAVIGDAAISAGPFVRSLKEDNTIQIWANGTAPPRRTIAPGLKRNRHFSPEVAALFPDIVFTLDGCHKITISDREALYTYAEYPKDGAPDCPRIRYVRWTEDGAIERDAILQFWVKPPA